MSLRAVLLASVVALAAAGTASAWWGLFSDRIETSEADSGPLPLPPVPPRITAGLEYDRCLGLLATDPEDAAERARDWLTRGGGAAAGHCLALSRIALGAPAEAAALLEQVAAAGGAAPIARTVLLHQAAQAWMMAGMPDRAHAAASGALAGSPGDPNLAIERAVAAAALDRHAEAVADLSRALDADPRRSDALVLRAVALRHLGRLDDARTDITSALALDADNPEALLESGILRQRQSDAAGARNDWERAILLAPDSPTADLARQNLALLEAGPVR